MEAPVTRKWINTRYYHQQASFIAAIGGVGLAYAGMPELLVPIIRSSHSQYGLVSVATILIIGPLVGLVLGIILSMISYATLRVIGQDGAEWGTTYRGVCWGLSIPSLVLIAQYVFNTYLNMHLVQLGQYAIITTEILTFVLCLVVTTLNLMNLTHSTFSAAVLAAVLSYFLVGLAVFGICSWVLSVEHAVTYFDRVFTP